MDGGEARAGSPRLSRLRRAEHLHRGGLLEEGQSPRRHCRRRSGSRGRRGGPLMAADNYEGAIPLGSNIASADIPLPAVRDYEQVDREIAGTLAPSFGWFGALGVAVLLFLWGAGVW